MKQKQLGDEFYDAIQRLSADDPTVKNIIDIGLNNTQPLMDAWPSAKVYGVSLDKEKIKHELSLQLEDPDKRKSIKRLPSYGSTVPDHKLMKIGELKELYTKNPDFPIWKEGYKEVKSRLQEEKALIRGLKPKEKDLMPGIKNSLYLNLDMVVLDGSDFGGDYDLSVSYGAKYIVLLGIRDLKNHRNHEYLTGELNYWCIELNYEYPGGFSIYQKYR